MRGYKFDITIWRDNSAAKFKEACSIIESAFPEAEKEKLLVDVDGSMAQAYIIGGEKTVVYDDYTVGAVYALSNTDLTDLIGVA